MNNLLYSFIKAKIDDLEEHELLDFIDLWNIRRDLQRNEILKPIGSLETNLYFVENGAVKICYKLGEQEIIAEFGFKNKCIFDLVSFFSERPSHFYIQALKSTKLIGISKADFYSALCYSKGLNNFWKKNMEKLMFNFINREIEILAKSPEDRYKRLQHRNPELFQNIPNKYIASYLGMSPETLSRLKKS